MEPAYNELPDVIVDDHVEQIETDPVFKFLAEVMNRIDPLGNKKGVDLTAEVIVGLRSLLRERLSAQLTPPA